MFYVSLSLDCVTYRCRIKHYIFELRYSVSVAFDTEHSLHLEIESGTFLGFPSNRVDKGLLKIYLSGGLNVYIRKKMLVLIYPVMEHLYEHFELNINLLKTQRKLFH
jgi:hypothetical protein